MTTLENLQNLWFVLIAVLFTGYSLLDGFDLGIGALLPFLGKVKEERDTLIGTIGPLWDGNEVWLITGGGALFAAFPQAYATAFSGFYIAFMLVLFCLIFRAVSFEFRAHGKKSAALWEWSLIISSFLAPFLFGVALGNVVYGVPLDAKMEYTGNFFTLLRPVPLIFGLMGLTAVLMQGATYAMMKTEGELQKRAFKAASIIIVIESLAFLVFCVSIIFFAQDKITSPLLLAGVLSVLAGIFSVKYSINHGKDKLIFWESSLSFIGLWIVTIALHFPNLIKAVNDPALSITIRNGSSSELTLKLMGAIAIVGMPVVIVYTVFVYRIFKGKAGKTNY